MFFKIPFRNNSNKNSTKLCFTFVFLSENETSCNSYFRPFEVFSMSDLWFLTICATILVLPFAQCNNNVQIPSRFGTWTPKADHDYYNYNNQPQNGYKAGSVVSIPAYNLNRRHLEALEQSYKQHGKISELPDPIPRHDELKEKLGFSLSSLLPTSILRFPSASQDSENQIETNGNDDNSPFLDDSELLQDPPQQSGNDNPALAPDFSSDLSEQTDGNNGEMVDAEDTSSSPGLFTRIRNVLPFGSGLISGLLNNGDNNADNMESENVLQNEGQDEEPRPLNNDNTVNSPLVLMDPSQLSITNDGENANAEESPGIGNLFRFRNPFQGLRNLLNLNLPGTDEASGTNLPFGTDLDSSANPGSEENPLTLLQSLADDENGLGGILGVGTSFLSTVTTTIGLTSENAHWFILLSLFLGPMIASAIAASVIAIVYASVYIPAAAIRNEDLDGDFYLLSLKRLYEILGIPDPLEELFDFKRRSYDGRSYGISASLKRALLAGTVHDTEECLERLACEVIGRKLMQPLEGKTGIKGWIGKGITWVTEKIKENDNGLHNSRTENYFSQNTFLRVGKALIQAVAAGMSEKTTQIKERGTKNACVVYTCDPVRSIHNLFNVKVKQNDSTHAGKSDK